MSQKMNPDGDPAGVVVVEKKEKTRLQRPRLYKVLFHNDDYTTQEFVVAVLKHVFHHDEASAFRVMMHVHQTGIGVAGIFTYEVAETKVGQSLELARKAEYPLQVTMEPESDGNADGGSDDKA